MGTLDQCSQTVNLPYFCMTHQTEYTLFCLNCTEAICDVCLNAGEHITHHVLKIPDEHGEQLALFIDALVALKSKVAAIARNCEELIGAPEDSMLHNVDDIQCHPIAPYQLDQVMYPGFMDAKYNHKLNFMIKSAYDVEWSVSVTKSDWLEVRLCATDIQVSTFRHHVTIVIPHSDNIKEICGTFEVHQQETTFSMMRMAQIWEQQFCNDSGDLVVQIGIRPLTSIVEELSVYQYERLKEANQKLSKRLNWLTGDHYCPYLSMYFNLTLAELRKNRILASYRIRDDENRQWYMNVKLKNNNTVAAYVRLFKGSVTECNFFVNLEHTKPEKTVRKQRLCKIADFDRHNQLSPEVEIIGWDELRNDAGFQRNGYLCFLFGICPLSATESGGSRTLKQPKRRQTAAMTPKPQN